MTVLATPANMRTYRREPRIVQTDDGPIHVEARQPFAYDVETGERYSATAGDYFMLGDDEPLTSSETGEPLVLAFEVVRIVDADEAQL